VDRWSRPSRLARWAVAIAAVVVVALVVSFVVLAAAYAVGGWAAIDDTWVGLVVVVSLLGGLLASLLACVLAVIAKMKHERWGLLWLPQSLFPASVVFLVLGELFCGSSDSS
jgi:hypothetical protein